MRGKWLTTVFVVAGCLLSFLAFGSNPETIQAGFTTTFAPPEPGRAPVQIPAPPDAAVGSATFAAADLLPCQMVSRTGQGVHVGFPLEPERVSSTGVAKVSAIFVDFPNAPGSETTAETLDRNWPQVEEYLESVSGGRVDIELRARHGWLRMSEPSTSYEFDDNPADEALGLADPSFDFTGTQVVWVIFERTAPTDMVSWTSLATHPNGAFYLEDGEVPLLNTVTRVSDWRDAATPELDLGEMVMIHESLHTFGLADLYSARDRYPDVHRFVGEFDPLGSLLGGDPFDPAVQSAYQSNELFAWHAWQLGWIDDLQVSCMKTSVRRELLTPAHTVGGTKAIVMPASPGRAVVVEARAPGRWDADLEQSGLLVYTVDTSIRSTRGPIRVQGPHDGAWPDGSVLLQPGQTLEVEGYRVHAEDEVAGAFGVVVAATNCDGKAITIDMFAGASGVGTPGDDVILGTTGSDVIDAGAGDDTVCAGSGDDIVIGGDGNDLVFGQDGRDILRGGPGIDELHGGDGDDRVLGGTGDDTLIGGEGGDYLGGFGGADTIDGGAGSDTIFGGFGADTINGGAGSDEIHGLIGDDTINGGQGDDQLDGDRGNDTINGGSGDDTIRGGNANDILDGDGGNDSISGGKADDRLSGGSGSGDTCVGNLHKYGDIAGADCEAIFGVP